MLRAYCACTNNTGFCPVVVMCMAPHQLPLRQNWSMHSSNVQIQGRPGRPPTLIVHVQDDDDVSARLQGINEAFEDSAPLRDVLLAVCGEFGLTHAARCLEPGPAAPAADVDMADATDMAEATGSGEGSDEEDGDESDGDEDATWSAAERDDKETIVSDLTHPLFQVRPPQALSQSGCLSIAWHLYVQLVLWVAQTTSNSLQVAFSPSLQCSKPVFGTGDDGLTKWAGCRT